MTDRIIVSAHLSMQGREQVRVQVQVGSVSSVCSVSSGLPLRDVPGVFFKIAPSSFIKVVLLISIGQATDAKRDF